MEQPSLGAVVRRLERVERENRRWKLVGAALATLLSIAPLK